MKRQDFLKRTCGWAAAATLMAGGKSAFAGAQDATAEAKQAEAFRKFVQGWIPDMLKTLDRTLSEEERLKFMEENGRACASRGGSVAWAKGFGGDVDKFLAEMRKHLGEPNAVRSGKSVRLTYEKCLCPLVSGLEGPLSSTYCLCTQGWTKAVYEALTGKPVEVALLGSIKRGDPKCLIEVRLA
ncbi:MAG: DUF6144 family protein [Candidatus Aminicenantes bacterium]|nr:DUF6144 family protein [Candidatus Aminicenantes bacterium]